jgi:RNA polymerase sigma-70 factor, ECF subfamily
MAYTVKQLPVPFRTREARHERERMTEERKPLHVGAGTQPSILQRIATGERAAVQECIDAYGGLIWSLARRWSPAPHEAEDAVQEIFIDLWKSAARFDQAQASETTFVAMIARRRLIDRRRAQQRHPEMAELSDELADTLSDPQQSQAKAIEQTAEVALATKAMTQLRPAQREVLQLALYQGLSHQEISEQTGMPLGTVKTYVRRGVLHIRAALGIRTLDADALRKEVGQ